MFLEKSGISAEEVKTIVVKLLSFLFNIKVWEKQQEEMFDSVRDRGLPLKLGGDARFCSQGHTAKYGSYSLINLETSKVLDVQLVQVRYRSICLFYDIILFIGISHE